MQVQGLSPETQQFLAQFGADLGEAVMAAPDEQLQQVSEGYRAVRQALKEPEAKAMMAEAVTEEQGQPAAANEFLVERAQPYGARAAMLQSMLDVATDPGLRELIENELATEALVREHLLLMQMAEEAGDDDLADEIGLRLRTLMDMTDQDPDDLEWLAAMDAEAQAVPDLGDLADVTVQDPTQAGLGGQGADPQGSVSPAESAQRSQPDSGEPAAGAAPSLGSVQPVQPVRGGTPEPASALDQRAHEAATSPRNDRPEPTEAQKEGGNYAKGHIRLHGLDISIENPAGSKRRPEWPDLTAHYGYVRGTKGRDGEQIDVFIGPNPDSQLAVVIDQISPESGRFDEHKVILGTDSEAEARELYLSNYSPDWQGLGAATPMSIKELKEWLATDPQKPRGKVPKPDAAALAQKLRQAWSGGA